MWLKHISEGESLESVCGQGLAQCLNLLWALLLFILIWLLVYLMLHVLFSKDGEHFFPNLQGLSINLCFCQGLERNVVSVL